MYSLTPKLHADLLNTVIAPIMNGQYCVNQGSPCTQQQYNTLVQVLNQDQEIKNYLWTRFTDINSDPCRNITAVLAQNWPQWLSGQNYMPPSVLDVQNKILPVIINNTNTLLMQRTAAANVGYQNPGVYQSGGLNSAMFNNNPGGYAPLQNNLYPNETMPSGLSAIYGTSQQPNISVSNNRPLINNHENSSIDTFFSSGSSTPPPKEQLVNSDYGQKDNQAMIVSRQEEHDFIESFQFKELAKFEDFPINEFIPRTPFLLKQVLFCVTNDTYYITLQCIDSVSSISVLNDYFKLFRKYFSNLTKYVVTIEGTYAKVVNLSTESYLKIIKSLPNSSDAKLSSLLENLNNLLIREWEAFEAITLPCINARLLQWVRLGESLKDREYSLSIETLRDLKELINPNSEKIYLARSPSYIQRLNIIANEVAANYLDENKIVRFTGENTESLKHIFTSSAFAYTTDNTSSKFLYGFGNGDATGIDAILKTSTIIAVPFKIIFSNVISKTANCSRPLIEPIMEKAGKLNDALAAKVVVGQYSDKDKKMNIPYTLVSPMDMKNSVYVSTNSDWFDLSYTELF